MKLLNTRPYEGGKQHCLLYIAILSGKASCFPEHRADPEPSDRDTPPTRRPAGCVQLGRWGTLILSQGFTTSAISCCRLKSVIPFRPHLTFDPILQMVIKFCISYSEVPLKSSLLVLSPILGYHSRFHHCSSDNFKGIGKSLCPLAPTYCSILSRLR